MPAYVLLDQNYQGNHLKFWSHGADLRNEGDSAMKHHIMLLALYLACTACTGIGQNESEQARAAKGNDPATTGEGDRLGYFRDPGLSWANAYAQYRPGLNTATLTFAQPVAGLATAVAAYVVNNSDVESALAAGIIDIPDLAPVGTLSLTGHSSEFLRFEVTLENKFFDSDFSVVLALVDADNAALNVKTSEHATALVFPIEHSSSPASRLFAIPGANANVVGLSSPPEPLFINVEESLAFYSLQDNGILVAITPDLVTVDGVAESQPISFSEPGTYSIAATYAGFSISYNVVARRLLPGHVVFLTTNAYSIAQSAAGPFTTSFYGREGANGADELCNTIGSADIDVQGRMGQYAAKWKAVLRNSGEDMRDVLALFADVYRPTPVSTSLSFDLVSTADEFWDQSTPILQPLLATERRFSVLEGPAAWTGYSSIDKDTQGTCADWTSKTNPPSMFGYGADYSSTTRYLRYESSGTPQQFNCAAAMLRLYCISYDHDIDPSAALALRGSALD